MFPLGNVIRWHFVVGVAPPVAAHGIGVASSSPASFVKEMVLDPADDGVYVNVFSSPVSAQLSVAGVNVPPAPSEGVMVPVKARIGRTEIGSEADPTDAVGKNGGATA